MTFQELYSFVESEARKLDLSKLKDKNEVYVADITGDNGGKICAVLKDGRMNICKELPAGVKPSCSATVSMENVEKMMTGHLNPVTAVLTGRVKIKGDIGKVLMLKDIFN